MHLSVVNFNRGNMDCQENSFKKQLSSHTGRKKKAMSGERKHALKIAKQ